MPLSTSNSKETLQIPKRPAQASERTCLLAALGVFLFLTIIAVVLNHVAPFSTHRDLASRTVIPPSPDWYLGYSHGGLDEYTIYNNLNGAATALKRADVVFLGNSHATFGFHRDALNPYFQQRGLNYYVMSFEYGETSAFPLAIIKKYDLHPKYLIINADPFFGDAYSDLAQKVVSDGRFDAHKFALETNMSFTVRRNLHDVVPYLPTALTFSDRPDWIIFRSYTNGSMLLGAYSPGMQKTPPVFPPENWSDPSVIQVAAGFKTEMDRRGTKIILTCIPPFNPAAANKIGHAINVPVIVPICPNMNTIDGNHLDDASAITFTQALLKDIDGLLK